MLIHTPGEFCTLSHVNSTNQFNDCPDRTATHPSFIKTFSIPLWAYEQTTITL